MRRKRSLKIDLLYMINRKFSRLTTILYLGRDQESDASMQMRDWWKCRCVCGKEIEVTGKALRNNHTRSCGCLQKEHASKTFGKHHEVGNPEYRAWKHMRQRCLNPKNYRFNHYGARGITICKRWDSFSNFLKDMGRKPSNKHSIERINNSKGYYPSNCKWATQTEQMNNTRKTRFILFKDKKQTITQWAEELGIRRETIASRLDRGFPLEKVFYEGKL